ncbi:hypothetical protein R1G70_12935 [Stenotrophomonas sp. C960]|uniref:hypothetical protein n=1 Tax=Stenotrophomonas TaxID=40323 RepID=UPI000FA49EE0|nr:MULTISPECIES: hypothetical protein [unclassified Stenotrophomonas]MDV3465562.1 hypothetical protein [Stenotrophomonas sp. C960]MDV3532411.1 hypothetical protein [Stenotrophomonas sp. C2866]
MNVINQLLTPARYLRIKSETHEKLVIDYVLPALMALATTAAWGWRPDLLSMGGPSGIVTGVSSLIQVLVGFYVATLAAVATFPTSSLDEDTNRIKLMGSALKRRRFLAYLFGYLALLSLFLFVALLFRPMIHGLLAQVDHACLQRAMRLVFVFIYQFVFWQMVFITLLGLYYLTDRIHRSNTDGD